MLIRELRNKIEKMDRDKAINSLNIIQSLNVNKHIGEKGKELSEKLFLDKQLSLIISPMACGKTTFSFMNLFDLAKEYYCQPIFVSPKVTLIQSMEAKYKCNTCYGGQGVTVNGLPVLTTPDSLYKVVNSCVEQEKTFVIVVDEVHECELNYLHRHKLWKPFEYYENENCVGLIGLTATPDNILNSIKWDNVIQVTPDNKFVQTPLTVIVKNLGCDLNSIISHSFKIYSKQKTPIIVRVNDKQKISDCKEILEKLGVKKVVTWFRDNPNEEEATMLNAMLEGKREEFDILLTTSLIDVGVEIYPKVKPIVIDFIDSNSRIIENIQFLGRFREGVKAYHIVCNGRFTEKPFQSYEDISREVKEIAQQGLILAEKHKAITPDLPYMGNYIRREYNPELNLYNYSIDEIELNAVVFAEYTKQITADVERLKYFLENHSTFNSTEIQIAKMEDDYKVIENLEPLLNEIKEENKVIREEKKTKIEELVEFVGGLRSHDFELFTTKPDNVLTTDKWRVDSFEWLYDFYWSEDLKEYRKRFYQLKEFKPYGNYSDEELWLKAFNRKWWSDFTKQVAYTNSNLMFNDKNPTYTIEESINRTKILVYDIRKAIVTAKGKEKGVKLTATFVDSIVELLQARKKSYEKLTPKKLLTHLNYIYNISEDRYRTITSAKTKLNLDKEF